MTGSMKARGTRRERQLRDLLAKEDWVAFRAPASLGCADVVAMRDGRIRFIECKATAAGPYHSFGPAARLRLAATAKLAGARAELCWWPPRGRPRFLPESEWPR